MTFRLYKQQCLVYASTARCVRMPYHTATIGYIWMVLDGAKELARASSPQLAWKRAYFVLKSKTKTLDNFEPVKRPPMTKTDKAKALAVADFAKTVLPLALRHHDIGAGHWEAALMRIEALCRKAMLCDFPEEDDDVSV